MVKTVLILLVGALLADAVWCRIEIWRLEEQATQAINVAVRTQNVTRAYESSLISCRAMVDHYVASAEQDTTKRVFTEIGMYRKVREQKARNRTKAEAVARTGFDDVQGSPLQVGE